MWNAINFQTWGTEMKTDTSTGACHMTEATGVEFYLLVRAHISPLLYPILSRHFLHLEMRQTVTLRQVKSVRHRVIDREMGKRE